MSKYNLMTDYGRALHILDEFVTDVEAVGEENVAEDWPDLFVTYKKARELVRDD